MKAISTAMRQCPQEETSCLRRNRSPRIIQILADRTFEFDDRKWRGRALRDVLCSGGRENTQRSEWRSGFGTTALVRRW